MFVFDLPIMSAPEYEAAGNSWSPDLNFTGQYPKDVPAVQRIISAHGGGLVAYFLCQPMPGMFTLELQWGEEEAAQKNMAAAKEAYEKLPM